MPIRSGIVELGLRVGGFNLFLNHLINKIQNIDLFGLLLLLL